MKKKSIALIATVFALSLVACNGAKADTPITTTTTPVSTTTTAPVETTTTKMPKETTTTVAPETTAKPVETTPAPTTEAPTTTVAPTETTTVEPETTTEAPTTTVEPNNTSFLDTPRKTNLEVFYYIGNDTYAYNYADWNGNDIPIKSGEAIWEGESNPLIFKIYRPVIDNKLCYFLLFNGDDLNYLPTARLYTFNTDGLMYGELYLDNCSYDYTDSIDWMENITPMNWPDDMSTLTNDNIENVVPDEHKQLLRNDWSEEDFPTIESLLEYYRTTDSMLENTIKEVSDFSVKTIRDRYDWSDRADWYTAEYIEEQRLKGEALIAYYKSVGLLAESTTSESTTSETTTSEFVEVDPSWLALTNKADGTYKLTSFSNLDENLDAISIPSKGIFGQVITEIGEFAFSDCNNLVSIKLPDTITSIGNYAFRRCSNLTNIEMPDNVIISEDAFWECPKLNLAK
ncbi:MAG: leucine-rich repeat domain-containing protein [Lachnospiraceae bacterium]|nr:leucine-rich repeat domain-containing protein [Lachnospiraceae bacterium]